MKLKLIVLALSGSIALVGCGGGGGGGSGSGSTPSASNPGTTTPTGTTPTTGGTSGTGGSTGGTGGSTGGTGGTGGGTGGTGGTGGGTGGTGGTSDPSTDPNALQLTVPDPTYAAGSIELSAYNALNKTRSTYGVGLLAQSALLDTASQNHSTYLNARLQAGDYNAVGHAEISTNTGYTGVTPADRIAYAKYSASQTGENLTSIEATDGVTSDPGVVSIETLLSGPYHRFSLLDPFRDVGFAHSSIRLPNQTGIQNTVVISVGIAKAAQGQLPANGWVGVWPADQATGVLYSSVGESPNPIPSNNGRCAGYPVSLQVKPNVTLTTTAFTLVEAATNTAVNVQLSTQATDANPTFARANAAYIMPVAPLKLSTTYTAHFVGSQNGTAIDKTWSFTTRADNVKAIYACNPS